MGHGPIRSSALGHGPIVRGEPSEPIDAIPNARMISPEMFKSAFEHAIRQRAESVSAYWYPWQAKAYTALFLEDEDCILLETAKLLKLNYATQWWSLDGIFYEDLHDQFPPD